MPAAEDDLTLLAEAARESGKIALRHFRSGPEVWEKTAGAGPVTEADIEIDRMLRHDLLAARPDYGWLSEETEDDPKRLECKRVFVVDPIDGTRAFIAGESHFSHSLSVVENGTVVAAAVYLPAKDMMFLADRSRPSTLNGSPIAVSLQSEADGASLLAAKPNFRPENWVEGVPDFARKFRPSLAYRMCLVAQGAYDAMLTLRDCWEWDIAAGDLIVRQAGGRSTDRLSSPLIFNNRHPKTKGCLAAGPALHRDIQMRLVNG